MSDPPESPPPEADYDPVDSIRNGPPGWPRPPSCLPASWIDRPPTGARVAVAGLVLVRQRPGTAKGVIFITLEDETGVVNVVVWAKVYEAFRRAVIAGRLLRVTGRLQRQSSVTHVVAEKIEDISEMLDRLLPEGGAGAPLRPDGARAADQPGTTYPDPRQRDAKAPR